jgi:hypothetical protein
VSRRISLVGVEEVHEFGKPLAEGATLLLVKASFRFSLIFWVLPLALVLVGMVWIAVTTHHVVVDRVGLGLTIAFGGGLFFLALITSLAADLYRNREVQEGTIEWSPALVWKAFLYLGAFFFLVAAFLAYHQGVWLSVGFVCFSIG